MYNSFLKVESCCTGKSTLNRTSEAKSSRVPWYGRSLESTDTTCYIYVGILEQTICSIWSETSSGSGLLILYKVILYAIVRLH